MVLGKYNYEFHDAIKNMWIKFQKFFFSHCMSACYKQNALMQKIIPRCHENCCDVSGLTQLYRFQLLMTFKFCTSFMDLSLIVLGNFFPNHYYLSRCSSRQSTAHAKKKKTKMIFKFWIRSLSLSLSLLCPMRNFLVGLKRNNDSPFICFMFFDWNSLKIYDKKWKWWWLRDRMRRYFEGWIRKFWDGKRKF